MRTLQLAALILLGLSLPGQANPRLESPSAASPGTESSPAESRASRPVLAPAAARGQLLYENHCTGCHQSMVHIRARTLVKSRAALRMQVMRWAVISKLRWTAEEVEEVVNYLNAQFYQFGK